MVNLRVERRFLGPDYTIGNFYINEEFVCNTLEDTVRIVNGDCSQKIYGSTAIPEGTYNVELIWWEKHQDYYCHIKDVPCFDGIMIHGGNTAADTFGCVLLGDNTSKGELTNCKVYHDKLNAAVKDQSEITITIE